MTRYMVRLISFQNLWQLCAHSICEGTVARALIVHSVMYVEIELLCVNIGFVDCARKVTDVNFFTNTTCPKCLSVISTHDLVSITKHFVV